MIEQASLLKLKNRVSEKARNLGFDAIGYTKATLPPESLNRLTSFLHLNRHGTMGWLQERTQQRGHPQHLWPEAISIITLGLNYGPDSHPLENLRHKDRVNISVYARNRDYHDLCKGMLKHLAQFIIKSCKSLSIEKDHPHIKVFVDTAPVMEKPLAAQAGMGWQGKHTNLVSREYGSWLFLGEIFTTLPLPEDHPMQNHCGGCHQCLDVCPTQAIIAPYQLDARLCISYLTIEYDGLIPDKLMESMGNRIYGCDDCLAICPWNKFAQYSQHAKLQARADLQHPSLRTFLIFDETQFRNFFAGSPVKRIGYKRFLRNILIAIGNSEDVTFLADIEQYSYASDPVIRHTAQWAIHKLTF